MGHDPASSVVNAYCQSHDIPNLFVVDGSVFPSASEKNPTLTIMALAARTADYVWSSFAREVLDSLSRPPIQIPIKARHP